MWWEAQYNTGNDNNNEKNMCEEKISFLLKLQVSETCLNQPSFGSTFVLGINRCLVYIG